jgi:hypothetical protein
MDRFRMMLFAVTSFAPGGIASQNAFGKAVEHFRPVTELQPGFAVGHYNLGLRLRIRYTCCRSGRKPRSISNWPDYTAALVKAIGPQPC